MLDLEFTLKNNELCLFGRAHERADMHEAGLFVRDTRFLSHFDTRINGQALEVLTIRTVDPSTLIVTSSNRALVLADGRTLQGQSIVVIQEVRLDTAINVQTVIQNFDGEAVALPITFEFGADFRDMFDVRGMTPVRRATPLAANVDDAAIILAADSSNGEPISTVIRATPSPDDVIASQHAESESSVTLEYRVELAHNERFSIALTIEPHPTGTPLKTVDNAAGDFSAHFNVTSGSPLFDTFIAQCDRDLAMLQTSFPEGDIPAAGIPWFIAPFGRDSLIVALQTTHAYPERGASTLRLLANLQGTKDDAWREEEPGKILHEMRYGDMARSGQAPHSPYYGSIDSTPLFVMAFAQHYLWHKDDALFDELVGNVQRALDWIETRGDLDGDGFVEFGGKANDGVHISQQGWKDSFDSLHFADGREAEGPIALVEVQGYVFASYAWLGEAVRLRGDHEWASALTARADKLRSLIDVSFWMDDVGYYAQALDGAKQQVDAISSNPGHLLFCGVPTQERADRMATMLGSPELNCGWGIRTLGTSMATYNPLSYHNGSVWPHDSSLAMAGLAHYGHLKLARDLIDGLVGLCAEAPDRRLRELYCGYARSDTNPWPVDYPVSCSPQAWAAATGLLAIRALLNIQPDPEARTVTVSGAIPDEWRPLHVERVAAFGKSFEIVSNGSELAVVEI